MILVDTTPLVALCDGRDSKHRAAVKDLESLAAGDFLVCDAVLTETCFQLPHPSQRQRLRLLLHDLDMRSPPLVHERDLWPEVFDWLAKYADHEPDWPDACLAVPERTRQEPKSVDLRPGVPNHMAQAEWVGHSLGGKSDLTWKEFAPAMEPHRSCGLKRRSVGIVLGMNRKCAPLPMCSRTRKLAYRVVLAVT